MKSTRILGGYLAREVLQYTAIGYAGVGSVLLVQNLLRQIESLASFGLHVGDVASLMGSLLVIMSAYAVPVAFLFGVLVAVGRVSADSELKAMRSLGVSHLQFALPFVLLGVLFGILTWWLLNFVEPDGRLGLRDIAADVASRGALIQPGRFQRLDREGDRLLFVDERHEDGRIRGVVISDRSEEERPFVVVAESGRFEFAPGAERAHLILEAGDIHFEPPEPGGSAYRRIAFETFDYAFEMGDALGGGPCMIQPGEMRTERIREVIHHFRTHGGKPPECVRVKTGERYEIQLHRRLALPVAPLLFAVLGSALGIRRTRGARSWGMLLCVGLAFGYYVLLSFGTFLAEEHVLPAAAALWLPNLVFGVAAALLLVRSRRAES